MSSLFKHDGESSVGGELIVIFWGVDDVSCSCVFSKQDVTDDGSGFWGVGGSGSGLFVMVCFWLGGGYLIVHYFNGGLGVL